MSKYVPPANLELIIPPGGVKNAVTTSGAKSGDLFMVPVDALVVIDDFNLRITGIPAYDKKLEDLTASIAENGFYRDKPISVMPRKKDDGTSEFVVTDGHRRLAAAKAAIAAGREILMLPVVPVSPGTSIEDLTIAMMQNGDPLSPYERAIGVSRLVKAGLDDGQIAKRLGITKTYVADLLTLMSMPAAIRNKVMAGDVSAGLAIKEFRADPKTAGERLGKAVETAKAKGKTKASGKDVERAPPKPAATGDGAKRGPKPNPLKSEFDIEFEAGATYPIKGNEAYMHLGKVQWWALSETEGSIDCLQDARFTGRVVLKEKLPGVVVQAPATGAEDL